MRPGLALWTLFSLAADIMGAVEVGYWRRNPGQWAWGSQAENKSVEGDSLCLRELRVPNFTDFQPLLARSLQRSLWRWRQHSYTKGDYGTICGLPIEVKLDIQDEFLLKTVVLPCPSRVWVSSEPVALCDISPVRELLYLHLHNTNSLFLKQQTSEREHLPLLERCPKWVWTLHRALKAGLPLPPKVLLRASLGLKKFPVDKATRLLRNRASHPQDCYCWNQRKRC